MPLINTYVDVSSEAGGLYVGLIFHYIPTLCLAPAKALVCLCICTDVPEPYFVADAVSIKISCISSIINIKETSPRKIDAKFIHWKYNIIFIRHIDLLYNKVKWAATCARK